MQGKELTIDNGQLRYLLPQMIYNMSPEATPQLSIVNYQLYIIEDMPEDSAKEQVIPTSYVHLL